MYLPVLTFPEFIAKTTCVVDYESLSEIKLSYKFNLINSYNSTSGYLVNFTRWNFLIDECTASLKNTFCNPWKPEKSHAVCHLINNNTVECSPLYIREFEERIFRFVGKVNNISAITSTEQYTYRFTKCYCRDGFYFNPHLSITADPINAKMLVRMKPYHKTGYWHIQSIIANITNYSSKRLTVIPTEIFQVEDEGFHFEIDDFDVCSTYSVDVKLETLDCINREMVPSVIKSNLSDTNISTYIESLSCWYNKTSIQVDGIGVGIYLKHFYFRVSAVATSFNVTRNGTSSFYDISLKENASFSISLCSKRCNLCSQNYPLKCNSQIVTLSKTIFDEHDYDWVIAISSFLVVILIAVLIFRKSNTKIKVIQDYLTLKITNINLM